MGDNPVCVSGLWLHQQSLDITTFALVNVQMCVLNYKEKQNCFEDCKLEFMEKQT